jgi:hypothetical protein
LEELLGDDSRKVAAAAEAVLTVSLKDERPKEVPVAAETLAPQVQAAAVTSPVQAVASPADSKRSGRSRFIRMGLVAAVLAASFGLFSVATREAPVISDHRITATVEERSSPQPRVESSPTALESKGLEPSTPFQLPGAVPPPIKPEPRTPVGPEDRNRRDPQHAPKTPAPAPAPPQDPAAAPDAQIAEKAAQVRQRLNRAERLQDSGDYDEALRLVDEALSIDPKSAESRRLRQRVLDAQSFERGLRPRL